MIRCVQYRRRLWRYKAKNGKRMAVWGTRVTLWLFWVIPVYVSDRAESYRIDTIDE